jgi:hypothetical protein
LTATLGLGLGGVAAIAAVVAGVWAAAGIFLGRAYDRGGDTIDNT